MAKSHIPRLNLGSIDNYYPYYLVNNFSERDLRREYTRLRDIASKRIKRLEKAGFANTQLVNIATGGSGSIARLSDLPDIESISRELTKVARFLSNRASTVSGIKRIKQKTLRTLSEHGFDFVNEANIDDFGEFMDRVRAAGYDKILPSDQIAEFFGERNVVSQSDIDALMQDFYNYLASRG